MNETKEKDILDVLLDIYQSKTQKEIDENEIVEISENEKNQQLNEPIITEPSDDFGVPDRIIAPMFEYKEVPVFKNRDEELEFLKNDEIKSIEKVEKEKAEHEKSKNDNEPVQAEQAESEN